MPGGLSEIIKSSRVAPLVARRSAVPPVGSARAFIPIRTSLHLRKHIAPLR